MTNSAKLTTSKAGQRVSKIRREPPPEPRKKIEPPSRERDILTGVTGVTLFAIAIAIITIGVSDATSEERPNIGAQPAAVQQQEPAKGR